MGDRNRAERPSVDLEVRPSFLTDADDMAPRLRDADLAEVEAHSGSDPLLALQHGIYHSAPCHTVVYNGRPACIFGVVPVDPKNFGWDWPVNIDKRLRPDGSVWLLGTDDVPLFSKAFLRYSKHWLSEVSRKYRVVGNIVDIRNHVHVRWIKWLGFTMLDTVDFGPQNLPFQRFYKEVRICASRS